MNERRNKNKNKKEFELILSSSNKHLFYKTGYGEYIRIGPIDN